MERETAGRGPELPKQLRLEPPAARLGAAVIARTVLWPPTFGLPLRCLAWPPSKPRAARVLVGPDLGVLPGVNGVSSPRHRSLDRLGRHVRPRA